MASVSDFIELAPDEIIVKEYRSFRMKKPQNATVNIAATNMRLILYGQSSRGRKSGRPTLTQEIRIEDIRGVEIYEKEKPSLMLAIIGLFFLASGAILAANRAPSVYRVIEGILGNGSYGIIIAGILGIIFLASAFIIRNMEFEILVKGNSSNLNTGMFSEKTVFKEGIDSPRILRELGSIIIKIQKEKERPREKAVLKGDQEYRPIQPISRKEFSVEDVSEEEEQKSPFEEECHEESESETVAETEEDRETGVQEAEDVEHEEDELHSEHDEDTKEEYPDLEDYDRGREKINVDDILETMQMIENPTSKKKDDFLF
ncbi:MAG: hypothetical protein JW931_02960 [Methanomicrobiaceae archaeon]|nr:hypothetical protein [Methanomicrobiaceae archaeon]